MRQEAKAAAEAEPVLASFLHMTIIMHSSLEKSMAFLLANKLASPTLLGMQLTRLFLEAYEVRQQGGAGIMYLAPSVAAVFLAGKCVRIAAHSAGAWLPVPALQFLQAARRP